MALPWESGTVNTSGGDSYGAGTLGKLGVLTIAGTLADGTAFNASAPVSQYNQWPFHFFSASGKDSVLGWVSVVTNSSETNLTGTNVSWFKAAGKGPLYPAGFTNALPLIGSPWRPAKNSPPLTLANPVVIISGGGLTEALTNYVSLQNYLTYTNNGLSLSISPSSGRFTGWFLDSGASLKQTMSGVVLTNEGVARGFFSGTNVSGAVLLQNQ